VMPWSDNEFPLKQNAGFCHEITGRSRRCLPHDYG
jgi:hypothetical protein